MADSFDERRMLVNPRRARQPLVERRTRGQWMSSEGRTEEARAVALLARCARPDRGRTDLLGVADADAADIGARAVRVSDWSGLLTLAEAHGVAPLLYHHLRPRLADLPGSVPRQLKALYARHRRANEVRLRVLREVLEVFEAAGVLATVLKGPLLIDRVYGDPGLRPMGDLDLLVPPRQTMAAQDLLRGMGFHAHHARSTHRFLRHNHLSPAIRHVDGVAVQVEIHHDAFELGLGPSLQAGARAPDAMVFSAAGHQAYSLPPVEVLWHLCRHSVGLRHRFRLIWAADIIGFAETFVSTIDWVRVGRRYPFVRSTLSLLHCLVPIPEPVVSRALVTVGRTPQGLGEDYRGWPKVAWGESASLGGRVNLLRHTLVPPEWWVRLNYGAGTGPAGAWRGRVSHGAAVVRHGVRLARDTLAMRRERVGARPGR